MIDSLNDEKMKLTSYKIIMKSFWEGEKIAFNTKIEKRQLGDNALSLYILLIN